MHVDPMEEMIFDMLLHLLICYPPGALQSNLIKDPFQPHGKGGNLPVVSLHNFIKICHEDIKWYHSAKMTVNFCSMWAMLVVGPMY